MPTGERLTRGEAGGRPAYSRSAFGPFWRFLRTYFVQFGVLDGARGLVFCALQAFGTFSKLAILWSWRVNERLGAPDLPRVEDDENLFTTVDTAFRSRPISRTVVFVTHLGKDYTVEKFLQSWGQGQRAVIRAAVYPGLVASGPSWWKRLAERQRSRRTPRLDPRKIERGCTMVFCDLERLSEAEGARVAELHGRLLRPEGAARILNHPGRILDRFAFLRRLHEAGINDFNVHLLSDEPSPNRWPVFLRHRSRHGCLLSPLLQSSSDLEAQISRVLAQGHRADDVLVVEFSDTRDVDGIFRKYGEFRIGDEIVARQIHFSRNWFLRRPDIRTLESCQEELEYVETNLRAAELRQAFELARVEYGRIDYAVRPGGLSVWEINTNPRILIPEDQHDLFRFRAHDHFARRFLAALDGL